MTIIEKTFNKENEKIEGWIKHLDGLRFPDSHDTPILEMKGYLRDQIIRNNNITKILKTGVYNEQIK